MSRPRVAGRVAWLVQACGLGQPGQVGTAAAAGLVPDPAQGEETVQTLMNTPWPNYEAMSLGLRPGMPHAIRGAPLRHTSSKPGGAWSTLRYRDAFRVLHA